MIEIDYDMERKTLAISQRTYARASFLITCWMILHDILELKYGLLSAFTIKGFRFVYMRVLK
ncbi:hypothetical protein DD238_008068 [Peronospora effusa]|uniref:Uncharacterized protein n=1 Tax=Peronospora effusa TaxID=542832 RepID=A0A3M6VPA9_9STRA|nr:hypothetical protein DD238_008068 [Peronospora effusa]